MLVQPVRAIGTLNAITQEGLAATARVFALLDQRAHIIDPPQPARLQNIKGELCFKKVSFAYQDAAILDDISFTVAPGQTVALVGPSGSGKELAARCIHSKSDRKEERFVVANCARLASDRVDAELFGSESLQSHRRVVGLF